MDTEKIIERLAVLEVQHESMAKECRQIRQILAGNSAISPGRKTISVEQRARIINNRMKSISCAAAKKKLN